MSKPLKRAKLTTELSFLGCSSFRQRIVCSILSGKSIRIDEIRSEEETPGLTGMWCESSKNIFFDFNLIVFYTKSNYIMVEYEASFLRLIDMVTNGSAIEINETGTTLKFKPGFLLGGEFTFSCALSRGIGYFLEGLIMLAPFGKNDLELKLSGITNCNRDVGVDTFRAVTSRVVKHFGIESMEIKVCHSFLF